MTPSEVLRGGRQYLIENGWHQHSYFEKTIGGRPSACAVGSLIATIGTPRVQDRVTDPLIIACLGHLSAVLGESISNEYVANCVSTVANWNDHSGRTFPEVIALFDAAIIRAEEDEHRAEAYEAQRSESELVPA